MNIADFLEDDLPQIKENVRKGFLETQTKVNRWITDFRKKLDGEDNDDPYAGPTRQASPPRRQNYGPSQSEQLYGIRRSADVSRKSSIAYRDGKPQPKRGDFAQSPSLEPESGAEAVT